VNLTPDTPYEIRLESGGQRVDIQARTRSERFPVGKTTYLPGGETDQTVYVREGGTADAWHLVTPEPGTKLVSDVFNLSDHNVVVEADYVIVRGLELKNAIRDKFSKKRSDKILPKLISRTYRPRR